MRPSQRRRVSLWLTFSSLVTLLVTVGLVYLRHDLDSYEARYANCMEIAKSQMPNHQLFYPSLAYDRATRECESQANR